MTGQFVDISVFQPLNIDWQAYKRWSAQGDDVSRVAIRSSYGYGYVDQHFTQYRQEAQAAGLNTILIYHYGYPQYNTPVDEANWQYKTVGNLAPNEILMLDIEEQVSQATDMWALAWLFQQEKNTGKLPGLYASDSYIRERFHASQLADFPLWLAHWTYDPNNRPACPPPWEHYFWLQYTDHAVNIPGIPGTVDTNIACSEVIPMSNVPDLWHDDGTTLSAPNGRQVVRGFREEVLKGWERDNWPLMEEASNLLLGRGTYQLFRKGGLGWTPELGIYQLTLGEWIKLAQKL